MGSGNFFQVINRYRWIGKRNRVTELLAAWHDFKDFAFLLGDKVSHQLFMLQSGMKKMNVIEDNVIHSEIVKDFGQPRLPHPFSNPETDGLPLEDPVQFVGQFFHLGLTVSLRDNRQYGLIMASSQDFYSLLTA